MTRTVKLENGAMLRLVDDDSDDREGVWLEENRGVGLAVFLTPRDVGRVIAALARTKAALADRRRVGLKGQTSPC